MTYHMKPIGCDPARIKGMSERLIVSHYENNYGGAVKRLNVIEEQLAELDYAKAPGFLVNGLKREELIAMNSMILRELFFDGLGDQSEPGPVVREALSRDFGSFDRWRSEFVAMGKGHVHGGRSVAQCRSPIHEPGRRNGRRSDNPVTEGGRIMRAFHILAISALVTMATAANAQEIDWKKVDEAAGRTAAVTGDVHRYGFPRTDLQVTLDGVAIRPALALGGWAAFKPMHGGAMVMGDLVLLDTEVNPVMAKLIENGIEITAVHNHVLRANPATFYIHIGGHGDPAKMAAAIRTALAESKTPPAAPAAASPPPAIDLDTAQLDQIIGAKGQANGGVYQIGVPRRDPVTENGVQIAPAGPMGVATAINFQPTGGGKAAITGDFVLIGEEVNPVVKALRANGIEVTAIHSHMLTEQPRLIFLHFWANGDALKLARGLRAALDKTASTKS